MAAPEGCIVVCDAIVDCNFVAGELPETWRLRLRVHEGVPSGDGVVAVLVGPDHHLSEVALEALPALRAVVVTSMGWDHVDVHAAHARGVAVVGVEPYCASEVAEHTLAMVLDLLRGVTQLDRTVRAGVWDYGGVGRSVRGTALGLVGLGRIGMEVAWRARVLGMHVAAYDPLLADGRPGTGLDGVRVAESLESLVSDSDVVSLHLPLTDSTRSLIDRDVLARFRRGAFFVNVSRGELVDEVALCEALRNGALCGAALDVLVHEPPTRDDPMLHARGTVLTPHAAWYSPAAVEELSRSAGRQLCGVLGDIDVDVDVGAQL